MLRVIPIAAAIAMILPYAVSALGGEGGAPRGVKSAGRARLAAVRTWVCYYGDRPREKMDRSEADLLVVDGDNAGTLPPERHHGPIILAYLSIGEAETYRSYWPRIKGEDWVLAGNPNWEGNRYVDVRSDAWRKLTVDETAKRLLAAGYDGLMLDTLDTVDVLLERDLIRYEGVANAMLDLVKALRETCPDALLVANGGLSIVEAAAPHLDGFMLEGILHAYDFEKKTYRRRTEKERRWTRRQVRRVRALGLPFLALDYADPDAQTVRQAVCRELRALGCIPYVSVLELDRWIPPCPVPSAERKSAP